MEKYLLTYDVDRGRRLDQTTLIYVPDSEAAELLAEAFLASEEPCRVKHWSWKQQRPSVLLRKVLANPPTYAEEVRKKWGGLAHAAVYTAFLAVRFGTVRAEDLLIDNGLLHETMHLMAHETTFLRDSGVVDENDTGEWLVGAWRALEERIPGFLPPASPAPVPEQEVGE